MKQNAQGWRVLLAGTAMLALIGCTGTPTTEDDGYYVVNPDGEVYKDADGNCWHNPNIEKNENRAECGDAIAETDGDNDGDGVPNSRDECPNTPAGTRVDARGCPVEEQAPIVLRGVTFEFDSARLTSQAERRLDNVVDALTANDEVRFRLDGHTDSIGTAQYNMGLSQRRVDTVRRYLIDQGVSASRITGAEGHGESDPVATNDTAAGRAQNRRVELNVMTP